MNFNLIFDGESFTVAKRQLLDFFEMHPSLFDENSYQVRSPVTAVDFADFVGYLKSKRLPDLTPANVKNLFQLSQEFGVTELLSECSRLGSDLCPVDFSLKSGQNADIMSASTLFESFRRDFPASCMDTIVSRLSLLASEVAKLRDGIGNRISMVESRLKMDLQLLHLTFDEFRHDIKELKQLPVYLDLNEDPLGGVIDHLT
jgi:hypothetical protein